MFHPALYLSSIAKQPVSFLSVFRFLFILSKEKNNLKDATRRHAQLHPLILDTIADITKPPSAFIPPFWGWFLEGGGGEAGGLMHISYGV